ncbi:cupin domain-containing protein [Bacillus sp. SM2101]|uniref:cupin domain-containing protein n=1 Tax=Bacillaceae TaxID=186817 RepID=UPI001BDE4ABA|nr:cupin domain-containing protein [Bacillus sp. SM2101]
MYCVPYMYQHPYNVNVPMHTFRKPKPYWAHSNKIYGSYLPYYSHNRLVLRDYGANPFVLNINEATLQNNTYRTAIWTGKHFQVTLMSLNVGEDIGLEIHPNTDQFLRVEQGQGLVQMGKERESLSFQRRIFDDSAIMIPAGMWHNVINTGNVALKLYSIYAPPNHPFGTVHRTKADAMAIEEGNGNRDGIQ